MFMNKLDFAVSSEASTSVFFVLLVAKVDGSSDSLSCTCAPVIGIELITNSISNNCIPYEMSLQVKLLQQE